jgi:hypothetical protein
MERVRFDIFSVRSLTSAKVQSRAENPHPSWAKLDNILLIMKKYKTTAQFKKLLLHEGTDLEHLASVLSSAVCQRTGWSALMSASALGQRKIASMLLDKKADINATSNSGTLNIANFAHFLSSKLIKNHFTIFCFFCLRPTQVGLP